MKQFKKKKKGKMQSEEEEQPQSEEDGTCRQAGHPHIPEALRQPQTL